MVPEFKKITEVWPTISTVLHMPANEDDFNQLVEFSDYLMDISKGDELHPLMGLLDLVGTMIEEYERSHIPEPQGDPIECLKYLMNEHGLKQKDLKELGSPGVISEVLSKNRELNKRQIKALSERFNCNPAIFI